MRHFPLLTVLVVLTSITIGCSSPTKVDWDKLLGGDDKDSELTDTDSGNSGDDGNTGNTGDTGNTGNTGNSGNTGDTGNDSDAGNSGNSGDTADDGNTGNSGDTGNSGNSGNTGDSGDTGNTGNTGDTGNSGYTYDFNGKWALKVQTTSNTTTTLPVIGEQHSTSVTQSIALVEMSLDGLKVKADATVCHVEVDTGSTYLTMSFSEQYIASLVPVEYVFTVTAGDVNYNLFMEDFVDVTGAKLDNPLTDTMPVDKNDPKVWDQDNDTNPGIRINCEGNIPAVFKGPGTIDVSARNIADIDITTVNENKISGGYIWQGEQVILQASNNALTTEKTTVPDHANSNYTLVRIDGTYDCAKVKAEKGTLFN